MTLDQTNIPIRTFPFRICNYSLEEKNLLWLPIISPQKKNPIKHNLSFSLSGRE